MLSSISTIASNLPTMVPGAGGIVLTGIQSFLTCASFSTETNALTRAQYSKFAPQSSNADEIMIGSRDGMTLIYLPAFLTSTVLYILPSVTDILFLPPQTLAGQFVIAHFLKRLLEVFFLHRYSGTVAKDLSIGIGIYYALVSTIILFVANPSESVSVLATNIGTGLFSVGTVGNFYHHYLLASLRGGEQKADEKKYVAPKGGLFEYVAAPHYLFELMAWLGIALVSNHVNAFLVFTSMTSYLSGRACSQNEWNRSKFPEKHWPKTRKNMVPFIF